MNKEITTKQLWLFIGLAYIFSFSIRLIWIYQFKDIPYFEWNDQLMLNTNDGYFWASGVQKYLFGSHQFNPRITHVLEYGIVFITIFIEKITHFSLETIMLYLPSIISSLVVIPIILITQLYKKPLWGFFAALLASITWSYYNRTLNGYYDTDMFSAMFPMFIFYFLIKNSLFFKLETSLYAGICIILYPFFYDQGQSIIYSIGILYTIYLIFKNKENKEIYKSFILIFFSLIPITFNTPYNFLIQILLLLVIYFILKKKDFSKKELIIGSIITFILFIIIGNVFPLIISKVLGYTIKGTINENGLHFYGVNQTIREASKIPFSIYADRTSGSIFGIICSLIGYLILIYKKPAFILALPLIGIGIFSMIGGLRFTVYAVPISAMSAIYLFYFIGNYIKNNNIKYSFISIMTIILIYPNIIHIINYKTPTVFNKYEVQSLNKLKKISSPKDYTIAWWDYGYPIWYYSDTNTLIDGGKHDEDNFIVSKILTSTSQKQVYNLSKLAIKTYVSNNYKKITKTIFKNKNPNELLLKLKSKDFKHIKNKRNIYLYLPLRMTNILPTIDIFSNLDLTTGNSYRNKFIYISKQIFKQGNIIYLGHNIKLLLDKNVLKINNNIYNINHSIITKYNKEGKLLKKDRVIDKNALFNVIYNKTYNQFIIVDNSLFNSTYIQLFYLENYNKDLFNLVISSPYVKIYKLKK